MNNKLLVFSFFCYLFSYKNKSLTTYKTQRSTEVWNSKLCFYKNTNDKTGTQMKAACRAAACLGEKKPPLHKSKPFHLNSRVLINAFTPELQLQEKMHWLENISHTHRKQDQR